MMTLRDIAADTGYSLKYLRVFWRVLELPMRPSGPLGLLVADELDYEIWLTDRLEKNDGCIRKDKSA